MLGVLAAHIGTVGRTPTLAMRLVRGYREAMQLTHLGHSCLLVEAADQRILIDPGTFSDFDQVRDLTAIVVTHQHPDHLDPKRFDALRNANPAATVLLEPAAAEQIGATGVERLDTDLHVDLGPVLLRAVGEQHAPIHDYVPRITNRGIVISAPEGPTLFHPGDALDANPGEIDLLCVPINAPWARISDTVDFVRRIAPARVVPIHDGLVNDTGRGMYLGHVANFGTDGGVEVLDLRGEGATEV